MGERSQGGQLRQAGVGEVPAVAGLQVLQRRQPRAVLQRGVRQPLVALPAAPQLLRASQKQPSQIGRRGGRFHRQTVYPSTMPIDKQDAGQKKPCKQFRHEGRA